MTAPGTETRPAADGSAGELARASLTLARAFAAGATMWCASPRWPAHAQHLSVEFVHPVIVGKRALPAVAVPAGDDPVAWLRPLVRAGDVVAAIGPGTDPRLSSLVRRTGVWGATSLWLGAGDRPEAGAADHVLWLDRDPGDAPPGDAAPGDAAPGDAAEDAAADGRLVLAYHLLWELTHVCFEHPGLLTPDPVAPGTGGDDTGSGGDGDGGHCVTCRDDARPAEVTSAPPGGLVSVRTAAGTETVDAGIVEPVAVGDLILVHAGTALAVLEREADRGR